MSESTSKASKRAVIYLRVSTNDQDPENQLREVREYAGQEGWEVVAVITGRR